MSPRRIQGLFAGVILLAGLGMAVGGCRNHATTSAAKARRGKPKSAKELPTTQADIYLTNLDGQISELTRLRKAPGLPMSDLVMLGGLHYTRGRFRGDLDEIQLGIDTTNTCIERTPDDAQCLLLRAEREQSLHRFTEARADALRGEAVGSDRDRVAAVVAEVDWNEGHYDAAIPAIRAARLKRPSTGTWIREAQLDHELGLEDEADAAFEAAEDLIVDTGPLVVAHLDLQRGIQKMQTGRLDEAVVFFRAAIERMPTYVAASEHLAEVLHMQGKDDEAIRIYEKVVTLSTDPEFAHALGALYEAHGKTKESQDLEAKARAGYAALLAKYPDAMYWHAAEFYLATGDTKQALEVLQKNLALRPNSASHVALARAELAAGKPVLAKGSIDKALAMPPVSAVLFWTASRAYRAAGDVPAAERFRTRAEKMNPRIASDEPR